MQRKPASGTTAYLIRKLVERRNVGNRERWGSIAGGALSLGLAFRARGALGAILAFLGSVLLFRGVSGYCPAYERLGRRSRRPGEPALLGGNDIRLRSRLAIACTPEEAYRFWRDFEKLPEVLRHLRSVEAADAHIHWAARGPLGMELRWDATVTEDRPGERLAWESVEDSPFAQRGEVNFRPGADGRGTELEVELSYQPPGGMLGKLACRYFGGLNQRCLANDLEHLKQRLESRHRRAGRDGGGRRGSRSRPVAGAAVPDQGLGPEPITPSHG